MTETEFNRNFLVRYYPTRGKTWNNKLVRYKRIKEIINNEEVFKHILQRIEESKSDQLSINLRRGESFKVSVQ